MPLLANGPAWRKGDPLEQNLKIYPWFQFCRNLLFWQAVWFLYFQNVLSAAEAILLAAIYDIATTLLEVPSGYLSDRVGRRFTLIMAMLATGLGCLVLGLAQSFIFFAIAQVLLGAGSAFVSGTDSALLYDSLIEQERESEVVEQEARAWRYSFSALAVSAFTGGLIAQWAPHAVFLSSAAATGVALWLVTRFREPTHVASHAEAGRLLSQAGAIVERLAQPALAWLFALTVAMYVFSHVPFVYGQPFIKEALAGVGLSGEAPVVSGTVVAIMMLISVAAGWIAVPLASAMGAAGVFMLGLAMQLGLIAVLAFAVHPLAIVLLLLRMVPNAITHPALLAIIQPKLQNHYRATYLSLQSLIGRLLFAASLLAGSAFAPGGATLDLATLQFLVLGYLVVGVTLLVVLALTARYITNDADARRIR